MFSVLKIAFFIRSIDRQLAELKLSFTQPAIVIFSLFSLIAIVGGQDSVVYASVIQFVANGAAIKIDTIQLTRFR